MTTRVQVSGGCFLALALALAGETWKPGVSNLSAIPKAQIAGQSALRAAGGERRVTFNRDIAPIVFSKCAT